MAKQTVKKRIIILGSTGTIGENTLQVIKANQKVFEVAALSAHQNIKRIINQAREYKPQAIAITDPQACLSIKNSSFKIYKDTDGLTDMIKAVKADIVINGIAGSAGMLPSLQVIESGKDLALANKETIVMAGSFILEAAKKRRVNIIPVDSEHSAVFQLLRNISTDTVEQVILTASGGPFRDKSPEQIKDVTVKQALAHPNWRMGKKITIDSATMANKGLEVIEANQLFNFAVHKIEVVIHAQSCVHSLIRTIDGSLYAQISQPDMRIPIQNALSYPHTYKADFGRLDLADCTLSFKTVDTKKYPMLKLAYHAAKKGGAYPIVYNAANEVAVQRFLQGEICFPDIYAVTEKVLNEQWQNLISSIDDIIFIDDQARVKARKVKR